MTKPTLLVELDDGTDTFPYDISADVRLVDGLTLKRGREDTQAAVTAGELTLALNNEDGKYSFNSTVLDSPSPIVVDQKIRIKETINATTFTRFTGYVKSWPVSWPAVVDTFSLVHLTATDAQARGERKPLLSFIQEEILADSPTAYYTFGEPEGATQAADSSGNQQVKMMPAGSGTAVTFGADEGLTTDGLTAAHFAGGQYLVADVGAPGTVECFFATTESSAALLRGPWDTVLDRTISISGGQVVCSPITSAATYNDGAMHHVALTLNAGTATLYVDGVSQGSTSGSSFSSSLYVGEGIAPNLIGTVAHVATYSAALSGTRIAEHASAGLDNFSGESGTDRITRVAGYAGIPVGTLDPSLTNVAAVDTSGVHAWPAIQDTVDAEGGLAYINGAGNLIFFNRHDAPGKTAPDITLSATLVRPDAQPTGDDESLVNYFAATAQGTGVEQVVRDEASELAHGQYPDSKTYLVQTDAEALDRANWIVGNYAEPTTRWPSMTLLLHKMTAAQAAAALVIEPGTWLRVTDFPSQTPDDTTVDVMVEGISETCSADEWTLTLNVVARELFQAWILGDSTYGVLGSTTRLGV